MIDQTKPSPNARSASVTQGPSRAAARSYLRAAGMQDGDFKKPMIGIVNTWSTVTPCNMHLDRLAKDVRQGVIDAGLDPDVLHPVRRRERRVVGQAQHPRAMAGGDQADGQGHHRLHVAT